MDDDDTGKRRRHEDRVRKLANRLGYVIHKSRARKHIPNSDNYGLFMLVEVRSNRIIIGSRFDVGLEEIEVCLKREQHIGTTTTE